MTTDNNRIDSPSKANQYQDIFVQAFFEGVSKTLESILHSPDAVDATLSTLEARRNRVILIFDESFQNVVNEKNFEQSELKKFRDLQKEFLWVWKSTSKS